MRHAIRNPADAATNVPVAEKAARAVVRSLLAFLLAATVASAAAGDERSDVEGSSTQRSRVRPVWSPHRPGSQADAPIADPVDSRLLLPTEPSCGQGPDAVYVADPFNYAYDANAHWYSPTYGWPAYSGSAMLSDRLWARAEYLLWWTQGSHVPPLVTSSPVGTAQADAGVLGKPTTTVLFGDTGLNTRLRSGGRFTVGYWLEPRQLLGVEASYLFLGRERARLEATSTGDPILARPFFNVETGQQDAHLIAFPNALAGSVSVTAQSGFQGAELLARGSLLPEPGSASLLGLSDYRVDLLIGYRFLQLHEDLQISESLSAAGPTTLNLSDVFDTMNEFHGAELGVNTRLQLERCSLDLLLKLAMGNVRSRVIIDGATVTTVGQAAPVATVGGLLAQGTNIGRYTHDGLAVIPELGASLGYDITSNLRATFGYTFIYWSKVARPGGQIDPNLNLSQLPPGPLVGAPRPQFTLVTTDFWAQGMNFGLEYRF